MSASRALSAALLAAAASGSLLGAASAEETESLNPMKALDRAALESFVQKPLFDPARQLPPPPPAVVYTAPPPAPPPPEPAPNLQLLGVVHGRHDLAIVHKDGSEKTLVLRSGDKLGGWTVVVRPPRAVTLREGDRSVDLAIFAKAGTQSAPPPPRTAPVAVGQNFRRPPDE